jgi:WD40 repeat protein
VPRSTTLDDLLRAYRAARDRGEPIAPEVLCGNCPELLADFLRLLQPIEAIVSPPTRHADSDDPSATKPDETSAAAELRPDQEPLPGYRLVRLLGKGGFGEVWEVLAPGGFRVAFKFVSLSGRAGEIELQALEIIRNIRHPNLLNIFGTWQTDGWLLIGMELADATLHEEWKKSKARGMAGVPGKSLVRWSLDTARVVDYLNKPRHFLGDTKPVGIQHGDIKPQNILLVGQGVKVGDFGLARVLRTSFERQAGGMTPEYAAPEVLDGRVSRWSDQYSLAVTWCHLRGGQLPYTGKTASEIRKKQEGEAPDLTMLPDGERLAVARALAHDPRRRWPDCRSFIRAIMDGLPRPPPNLLDAILAGTTSRPYVGTWASLCYRGHTDAVWSVAVSPGGTLALSGGMDHSVRLWNLQTLKEIFCFDGHAEGITAVAFTPDGLACSASLDGTVRLCLVPEGTELRRFVGHSGRVLGVACAPDGRSLASCGADGTVRLWDVETVGLRPALQGHAAWVYAVAYAGDRLLSAGADGTLRLWDSGTGVELQRLEGHTAAVRCVAVGPDGTRAVSGGEDCTVILWDLAAGQAVRRFNGHTDWVRAVAWTPDGHRVVTGGDDETLCVWDSATGELLKRFEDTGGSVLSLAVTPDGRFALAGSDDATVWRWELPS